jgi:tetratricopeptide (TPR) repeat protein
MSGRTPHDPVLDRLRAVGIADSLGRRLVFGPQVGAGGMGRVYRATDERTGATVAVKLVRDAHGDTDLTRFAAEAEILEALDHPAIVAHVGHGTTADGDPYLAMAWLDGESLSARLARGPLGLDEVLVLGRRVANGLAAAHAAGIVHRDLKPSNIVLVDGDVARATIVDFGVARRLGGDVTRTGEVFGTPGYMAPEQVRGQRDLDGRADLFALGCVLYHCLTGRRAFEGEEILTLLAKLLLEDPPPLRALRPDAPPRLEALVAQLLAKDHARRPVAAGDVSAELAAIANALASGDHAALAAPAIEDAAPPAAPTVPDRRRRRRRLPAILAAIALAGGATAAGVMLGARRGTDPCRDAASVDDIWTPAARARVSTALAAVDVPYADTARAETLRGLDAYARDWRAALAPSCAAADSRARRACWSERRRALTELVGQLSRPDARVAERAVRTVQALPPPAQCADAAALAARAADDERAAVEADLVLADVQLVAERFPDGRAAAERALAGARRARDRGLETRALIVLGRIDAAAGTYGPAVEHLAAAAAAAPSAALRADAWTALADALQSSGKLADADKALEQADAALREAPGAEREAEIANVRGQLLARKGKPGDALHAFERALALRTELHGPDSILLAREHSNLGTQYRRLDRPKDALAHARRAFELVRVQGDSHPDVARRRYQVGLMLQIMARWDEAKVEMETAASDLRRAYGDRSIALAEVETGLATLYMWRSRTADAIAHWRAAIAIYDALVPESEMTIQAHAGLARSLAQDGQHAAAEAQLRELVVAGHKVFPSAHPIVASIHGQLAFALYEQKRHLEARDEWRRSTEQYRAVYGELHSTVADGIALEGTAEHDLGNLRVALALHLRAKDIYDRSLPPDHPKRRTASLDLAEDYLALGQPARALPHAELALSAYDRTDFLSPALCQWALARARWGTGRDRRGAVELARTARATLARVDPKAMADVIADIDRWLAGK